MEVGDYFPGNQWISMDAKFTDFTSPKIPYLILGTKGVHQFEVNIIDGQNPTVTTFKCGEPRLSFF